ncbi:hypothetical protein CROQUDRAFT_657653 [Cronartium quercuum f. sp. fusiforme G11]|uniref:Uncharacterized protein n=1 Tax=Cronartium quercuum f. sp. fusiforme G11 TaxID=708437 RepID=A0A9P6NMG6_9BASI|nr:hypothetical protein CROQUDRAFT_657653 [Cronartium quercuum f. sp. fusiforme G11]
MLFSKSLTVFAALSCFGVVIAKEINQNDPKVYCLKDQVDTTNCIPAPVDPLPSSGTQGIVNNASTTTNQKATSNPTSSFTQNQSTSAVVPSSQYSPTQHEGSPAPAAASSVRSEKNVGLSLTYALVFSGLLVALPF